MPPNKLTPQVKIKHRIYKVTPDGLLKEPKDSGYGGSYGIFDDFNTIEAASEALLNSNEDAGDYVVLPVLVKSYTWE